MVCLSDTHGLHDGLELPEGDILVHAGDVCNHGSLVEAVHFLGWFESVGDYQHGVLIAGNHDRAFEDDALIRGLMPENIHYLNDSGVTIGGLRFWGSPVTPFFRNWAFNRHEDEIGRHWAKIPDGVDVLITHGPPQGILDRILDGEEVGCPQLLKVVRRIQPQLHLFGYIHEGHGTEVHGPTRFVNASICTVEYEPIHLPISTRVSFQNCASLICVR